MSFTPSAYQQAVFDFITGGTGHAIVRAVAGSGKTTTLVQALNLIDPRKQALFLAFNKSIAQELQARVPSYVSARTLNSLGFGSCMANIQPRPAIDATKVRKIIKEMLPPDKARYTACIGRIVALCKANGIVPGIPGCRPLAPYRADVIDSLMDAHDIEVPGPWDEVYELAAEVLRRSVALKEIIDFDDQLYLPVIHGWTVPQYDWVFVDEAQDLSLVQRALVKKALKPNGRLVAVGDDRQAIYAFRGADSRSMEALASDFSCTDLPLSISYRCAKKIVALAKKLVPWIESNPAAPDGEIESLPTFGPTIFSPDDMVVCRNTAPLVTLAFRLLRARVPCRIMGKDIGDGLKALINKLGAQDIPTLLGQVAEWAKQQTAAAIAADKPEKAELIADKAECIRFLGESITSGKTRDLVAEIDLLFSSTQGVTLATVHKAKGMESRRVFILDQHLMPSRYAKTPEALQQEHNLIYVAITRAKHTLTYITGSTFKE